MYTLLPLLCLIAAVSSTDLQVGAEGGKIIYDSKVEANPAIWKQVQNLTVNATGNEIINRVVVTDLRPNKDGEVKIVEGGAGQKNVTLELKSPTVLRGFEFQVQVFAAPDRKGRETEAETSIESEEVQPPYDISVPIVKDTVINEEAKPITTEVVDETAEEPKSDVESPVAIKQMKKRDTSPELSQESEDTESLEPHDTNDENSKEVAQETVDIEDPQDSDSKEIVQEPAVQEHEDTRRKKRDTNDMSQQSQVDVGQYQLSVDSQDSEGENEDSQESDSVEAVEETADQQGMKKRDTSQSQESQVNVDQLQQSVDSQEDLSQEEEVSQESGSEEGQESSENQQQKRAAQEMPQIQISGEMPDIQLPDVQLPEIEMPEVQMPEIQITDGMPEVQIGIETEEQPQKRAAQDTSETEGVLRENLGENVPQEGEQINQDPIAQYVSDQTGSNENPIQAPLVPEIMLEENNSTHFNDSAVVVERSASKYEQETEPPTEPTTTEETTTTETPTEPTTTTTEEPKKHYHHHNWHNSEGYY